MRSMGSRHRQGLIVQHLKCSLGAGKGPTMLVAAAAFHPISSPLALPAWTLFVELFRLLPYHHDQRTAMRSYHKPTPARPVTLPHPLVSHRVQQWQVRHLLAMLPTSAKVNSQRGREALQAPKVLFLLFPGGRWERHSHSKTSVSTLLAPQISLRQWEES